MARKSRGASRQLAPFFIAGSLLSGAAVLAEVPVVDIEDSQTVTPVRASAAPLPPANVTGTSVQTALPAGSRQSQLSEIFTQMQQLRQEVQELRGLVEQQTFEIQTLKQQRKDDYVDLDRRIAALQAGSTAPATVPAGSAVAPDSAGTADAEKDSYDSAYTLLELNRKDDAILAFRRHINMYPKGEYAPNAYYWLGQIYLTQNQLDSAQEQFVYLLKNYPDNRKGPDAKFALGKVYFQQGKKAEAKKLIQEVSQGDSKTATLAKTFLQANF